MTDTHTGKLYIGSAIGEVQSSFIEMVWDIRLIVEKVIRQHAFLILRKQSLNYFLWNN